MMRAIRVMLALAVILSLSRVGSAQDQAKKPDAKILYVVEMIRGDDETKNVDRLVQLRLTPDGNLGKGIVVTPRSRYFFGNLSKVRIVDGRYIVTEYAGIIDVQEKRIINDQGYSSELLGIDKGQVFYRVHNLAAPSAPATPIPKERLEQFGDWSFNLANRTRTKDVDKPWRLDGLLAPDRNKAIFHGISNSLWLDEGDKKRKELGKGFTISHSKYDAHPGERRAPILWLDSERILTQQGNGKLVTLDIHGKVTPLCDIAGTPAVNDSPRLWRDPKGRIIYSCGRAEFVIDVQKKTAAPLEEYALGHGFETPVEPGARGFRDIFFEGKRTGAGVFTPADVRTAPEVIAVYHRGDPGSRRYVGVLWTKLGFAWRGADMDYAGIIGWAN